MTKSHYTILGILPDADDVQIRSAYRRLAKTFHPDRYAGDSQAFREIQEAYEVLSDDRKRRQYEAGRAPHPAASHCAPRPAARPEPLIPRPDDPWERFETSIPPGCRDVVLEVSLTPEQARQGGGIDIWIPIQRLCGACGGYGGVGPFLCPACAGLGRMIDRTALRVTFPPGITSLRTVEVRLDRFGCPGRRLVLYVRPSS